MQSAISVTFNASLCGPRKGLMFFRDLAGASLSGHPTVTIFGGTGFLGRRIVDRLLDRDFTARIAVRHIKPGDRIVHDRGGRLEAIRADINDEKSVSCAVADAFAVVNAVSLYVE